MIFLTYWCVSVCVSALTIAVGIFIGLGIPQTEMDNSTNAILAQNDPYKPEIDQAKLDFRSSPSILFAFEGRSDVFTVDTLAAIESLNIDATWRWILRSLLVRC